MRAVLRVKMTDSVQMDLRYQRARMAKAGPLMSRARTTTTILSADSCPWRLTLHQSKHRRNRKHRYFENRYHVLPRSFHRLLPRKNISPRETILARTGGSRPSRLRESLHKSSDREQLLRQDLSRRSASRIETARQVNRNQVHTFCTRTRAAIGSAIHLGVIHL